MNKTTQMRNRLEAATVSTLTAAPTKEVAAGDRMPQVSIIMDQINQHLEEQNKLLSTLENKLAAVCHPAAKEATDATKVCTEDLVPLAQALVQFNVRVAYHNEWIKGIISRIEV